jgi:phospholipid N-methyltransferase
MTKVIDGTIGAVSEVGSGRGVKRLLRRGLKIETMEAMEVTKIVERLVRVFRRFLSQNKTGSMMERMIT